MDSRQDRHGGTSGPRAAAERPRRRARVAFAAILACWLPSSVAAQQEVSEYAVKAAFVYNFAKFATWPDAAFQGTAARLRICTIGPDQFGSALDVLADKLVTGRAIEFERLVPSGRAAGCHILFAGGPDLRTALALVEPVRDRPVLTVGEAPGFAGSGGMIGLVIRDSRVRFEIDPDAVRRGGLALSSQLLKLATIVTAPR